MKKGLITTFCLLALTVSSVVAQQRWSAGPRLGLNLSTAVGDIDNTKLKPGLVAGGFVMYSSVNHFAVSLDALYSQRGFRYKQTDAQGGIDYRQRVNYLELPLLFRYFLNRSGDVRPNIFIGPNVGFLLGANRTNPEAKNRELFRKADFGATAGLGLNFRVGQAQRLHLDARYTFGLSDMTQNVPLIPDNRPDGVVRNSTINLTLGYGIGIGRNY
ncbi:porin family protein [Tellurirhabdus rosea]|uniref:porin family protein n=1 Tax=Tellurirhabdus rosea TaxID=2674997 RepID=UPI00225B2C96|nr:porin family protein [Tellurirhabdus rosea]